MDAIEKYVDLDCGRSRLNMNYLMNDFMVCFAVVDLSSIGMPAIF